jgi:Protein of unknown function (DUF3224)
MGKTWVEKPYSEGQDLPKLTRAAVTKTFTGDITGDGHVEYCTGDLRGLRGEGTSAVGHGTEHPLTLNYELG